MATITYNSKSTEVPNGKVATLPCSGQVMKSDISVSGAPFAILTYNGAETRIEEGKTAVLPCNGKVMKGDVSVNTKYCQIIIYDTDDKTVLGKVISMPDCAGFVTVSTDKLSVQIRITGADGTQHTATYQSGYAKPNVITSWLKGVSKSNYFQPQYKTGDSFTIEGYETHHLSLRKAPPNYGDHYVSFLGLGYVDGFPCYGNITGTMTWDEWVNYGSTTNKINAQIIDGHVYTSDGKKVLYNSDGRIVSSTELVVNLASYMFVDVIS